LSFVGIHPGGNFRDRSHCPACESGKNQEENLCLSCPTYNRYKAARITAVDPITQNLHPLYHPVLDDWNEHFNWSDDGSLILEKNAIGRATIGQLRVNRPIIAELRRYWLDLGHHPVQLF